MLVCRIAKHLCITWRSRICCLFLPRKLLFSRHLTALYHLYFIYFWFYSSFIHALHGRQPFPRALSSTHFLLHQYFISSSPLFSTCCCCFHPLSSFRHVFMQSSDIYSDSDPLRPPLSLPLLFFVPCFFTGAGDSMMFCYRWCLGSFSDIFGCHACQRLPRLPWKPVFCPAEFWSKTRNFLTCRKTLIEAEKWGE